MKYLACFALIFTLNFHGVASAAVPVARHNILQWPRMQAKDFGCYLEKTFNIRDKKFNCSLKHYVNPGDPCKHADVYHEGPAFPHSHAARIHPLVKDIQLSWEHGELQDVTVSFKRKLRRDEIEKMFALPKEFSYPKQYPNIIRIDIQDCSKDGNCLGLAGFEHMGGADVDCGAAT